MICAGNMGSFPELVDWEEAARHARSVAEGGMTGDFRRPYALSKKGRSLAALLAYELKGASGYVVAQRNAAFLLEKLRADGRSGTAGASRFLAGWGAVKAAVAGGDATADESAAALAELSRLAAAGGKEGGTCSGGGGAPPAGVASAGEGKEKDGEGSAAAAAAAAAAFTARRSRAWLERAAAQGSIDAMVLLGDLHYYGDVAAADAAAAAAAAAGATSSSGGGTVVALKGGAGDRATRAQEATGRAAAARWYVAACRASEGGRSRSRADYRGLASDARARWNLAWMHLMGAPMGEDAKRFRCRRGRGGAALLGGVAAARPHRPGDGARAGPHLRRHARAGHLAHDAALDAGRGRRPRRDGHGPAAQARDELGRQRQERR